jgi:agmatinase
MNKNTLFGSKVGVDERIVVVGLPFGHGSSYVSSCQNAPSILRGLSSNLNLKQGYLYEQGRGRRRFENCSISDAGDFHYHAHNGVPAYSEKLEKVYGRLIQREKIPLTLGGDHLVTLPILKSMSQNFKGFQVIHVDAHSDFQVVRDGDHPSHANFMNFVCKFKAVKKVIQVGLRTFSNHETIFDEKMVFTLPSAVIENLLPDVPIYITIDTDALDPLVAPAVNHPVWQGLQWEDINTLINQLRMVNNSILGMDWVEYAPQNDTRHKLTGLGIVNSLLSWIEFLSERRI